MLGRNLAVGKHPATRRNLDNCKVYVYRNMINAGANASQEKPAPKGVVPARRWTRPGILDKMGNKCRPDYFFFDKLPEPMSPVSLNINDIHLKWEDGFWSNLGTDYQAACTELSPQDIDRVVQENNDLAAKIEILLDMNTNYELEKARLREKLQNLEEQIRTFPGLNDYSDSF